MKAGLTFLGLILTAAHAAAAVRAQAATNGTSRNGGNTIVFPCGAEGSDPGAR